MAPAVTIEMCILPLPPPVHVDRAAAVKFSPPEDALPSPPLAYFLAAVRARATLRCFCRRFILSVLCTTYVVTVRGVLSVFLIFLLTSCFSMESGSSSNLLHRILYTSLNLIVFVCSSSPAMFANEATHGRWQVASRTMRALSAYGNLAEPDGRLSNRNVLEWPF